jgi:transcriptional regulator GlxA family with amidase domain
MDQRVDVVIALMKTNLHRKLSLGEMGKSVNLSPPRLRQIFKAETGVAPLPYLRALRIERAKELLENTFLSIKEIAGNVGMSDASHFVRNFQTAFGVTPARHRAHYIHTKGTRTGRRKRNR